MKKKIFIGMIIVAILAVLVLYTFFTDEANRCEDVFGISLPADAKKVYSMSTKENWMGERTYFDVYTIDKSTEFNLSYYTNQKDQTFESIVKETIDSLEVENKYYPDFSLQYMHRTVHKMNNQLRLIFFPDLHQIIAISDIM